MKDSKPLAVLTSDLHISDWANFKTRTDTAFDILKKLAKKATKLGVPLIHTGDLFDKPDKFSNQFLGRVIDEFNKLNKLEGFTMLAISGNHSCDTTNKIGEKPISWERHLSKVYKWMKLIDFKSFEFKNSVFHGVPYIDHNIGLSEYLKGVELDSSKHNILLLHTDYPGAKNTQGIEVTSENININVVSRFDLVLSGHIHKAQRLAKKVYMIGAPYQLHRSDRDCQMGYWMLYEDLSLKFIPLDEYPKFIHVTSPDEVKEDGNYYTVIAPVVENDRIVSTKVSTTLTKVDIVKAYLKETKEDDSMKRKYLIRVIKEVEDTND